MLQTAAGAERARPQRTAAVPSPEADPRQSVGKPGVGRKGALPAKALSRRPLSISVVLLAGKQTGS